MTNWLKEIIQDRWQNLAFEAKCYLKSHTISMFFQFILLFIPIVIWTFALKYTISGILEIIWFLISILGLLYYIFYWKNTQLYKEYGEKYISLHNELKEYYKAGNYSNEEFNKFKVKHKLINDLWKPNTHFFSLYIVNMTIEKEMTSWNEDTLWWNK